ncbi:MAG: acetylglutamate kinase [Planctomycetota bacterium]
MPGDGHIVVKLSGRALDDEARRLGVCRALAGLAGRGVIVHGGGVQIDALFDRLREPVERVDGIRRTPESQVGLVAGVLAGTVNTRLVATLRSVGVHAVGTSLASWGVIDAEVDPAIGGRVGRVGPGIMRADGGAPLLADLLAGGWLPVVSPIACDRAGGLLNINADDAAAGVATVIGAERVVMLTDVPGVRDEQGGVIGVLDEIEAERLIEAGVVRDGMVAKLRAAFAIASSAGCGVCIASSDDASRAIVPGQHVGTLCEAASGPALARRGTP